MYRRCIGSDPLAASLDFSLGDVAGAWVSHEGAPRIRIYRNRERRAGGYYLELSYGGRERFVVPIRRYWGNIRYFNLYGFVGLAYDAERDVLQLSSYGDYYRLER